MSNPPEDLAIPEISGDQPAEVSAETAIAVPDDAIRGICRAEDARVCEELRRERSNEVESLAENVRALRRDVNVLLERRSDVIPRQATPGGTDQPSIGLAPNVVIEALSSLATKIDRLALPAPSSHEDIGKGASALQPTEARSVTNRSDEEKEARPTTSHRGDSLPPKAKKHKRARKKSKRRKRKNEKKRKSSQPGDDDPSSDSSSSSSSSSSSDQSSSEEELSSDPEDSDDNATRPSRNSAAALSTLRKGPKHKGLKSLRSTNPLYKELLDYRFYRLDRTSHKRSSRQTGKVKGFVDRLRLSMKDILFSGDDAILIFEFLRRFVEEANTNNMNEAQAYLALPKLLSGFALDQYLAVKDTSSPRDGGVTNWPEAVQYLLRAYATSNRIQEAILRMRDTRQQPQEDEETYSTRLNNAVRRCGNVHSSEERMTMFVDGLLPSIRSLVARHRESHRRSSYIELVHFARAEGDAHRARVSTGRKPDILVRDNKAPSALRNRAKALSLEVHPERRVPAQRLRFSDAEEFSGRETITDNGEDAVHFLDNDSSFTTPTSLGNDSETIQSVTTTGQNSADAAMAMGYHGGNRKPAPGVPFADRRTQALRPGWVDRNPKPGQGRGMGSAKKQLICHICYALGHISPECNLSLRELYQVVRNYLALTEEQKSMVPILSYLRASATFTEREQQRQHVPGPVPRALEPPAQNVGLAGAEHDPNSKNV